MSRLDELKGWGAVVMAAGPWGFTLTWFADATGREGGASMEATGTDFDAVLDVLYLNVMKYRKSQEEAA